MTWTDERITELTELWEANTPTNEIARIMGLTKNQVIGKAHRLELPGRPSPIIRVEPGRVSETPGKPPVWTPERNERLTELHKAGTSQDAIAQELGLGKRSVIGQLSRLGLTRQPNRKPHKKQEQGSVTLLKSIRQYAPVSRVHRCQYIEGEPSIDDACKCGAPVQVKSSYCPEHHAICWYMPRPKANRAA